MTLPHHPEAQGTAVTPCAFSSWVTLENLKGSLQVPSSPLDLHWKHLRSRPASYRGGMERVSQHDKNADDLLCFAGECFSNRNARVECLSSGKPALTL